MKYITNITKLKVGDYIKVIWYYSGDNLQRVSYGKISNIEKRESNYKIWAKYYDFYANGDFIKKSPKLESFGFGNKDYDSHIKIIKITKQEFEKARTTLATIGSL